MEFHVSLADRVPDLAVIGEAVQSVDPSAMVDIDADGRLLRIAAAVDATGLVALLDKAGYPVTDAQVRQLPSICCGGCSG